MGDLVSERHVKKARKGHFCDAWRYIDDYIQYDNPASLTYVCEGIAKGSAYNSQTVTYSGEIWTFKACYPCLEIAKKHKIDLTTEDY